MFRSHRDGNPLAFGIVLFLLSAVSLTAQEKTSEWRQFRGPGGLGASAGKGLPVTWSQRENIAWKTDLPGAGTSSPVVIGKKLFLTCYSGYNVPGKEAGKMDDLKRHVLCLDPDTGKILWDKEAESKLPEQARIRDDHGYASNTPAADEERVYVFFGKSGVFAFDHDGKKHWQTHVGSKLNGWGSAASPILYKDLVIVNASVESDSMVALNRKTGKEVWTARGIRDSWNTPILVPVDGGKTELVVAIAGKVLGFDPATGEQLWSCATDIGWYMVPSMVAHEGIVYCIGGRSGIAALAVRAGGQGDVTKTHRLWTGRKGSNVSSPVFHNGHLYWMNDNQGMAYCAEGKTGKIVYEERIQRAGEVYASALLADGKIYQVSRDGRIFVLVAKPQYELLAVNDLRNREMFNAGMIAAAGGLYLRSDRFLYCIKQK